MHSLRYLSKILQYLFIIFFPFFNNDAKKKKKLLKHGLFINFNNWLRRINSLNIPNSKRAIKHIMSIKITTLQTETTYLLRECIDREFENTNEFSARIRDWYENVELKSNKLCLEEGIPESILNEYNKWHAPRFNFVKHRMGSIAKSCFYTSKLDKLDAMLILINSGLVFLITNSCRTLNKINGDLTKDFNLYNLYH